jgi:hypothetical protein
VWTVKSVDERKDFLARGGDEANLLGECERKFVLEGNAIVVDGGEGQGLTVKRDREDRILASQALGNQRANCARDRFAPPFG